MIPGVKTRLGLDLLLSPSAQTKALDVGERVSYFGLENVIQSSDFLPQLARRAQAGDLVAQQVLNQLSTGASHTDVVDQSVTRILTEMLLGPDSINLAAIDSAGNVDYDSMNVGVTPENIGLIKHIRRKNAAAKAQVVTVSLTDPRYLTQRTLDHITHNQKAFRRIKIEDSLGAIIGSAPSPTDAPSPDTFGTLQFDGGKYIFSPTAGGPSVDIDEVIARNYIQTEINARRTPATTMADIHAMPARTSNIKTLGINPIQQTNIEHMSRLLGEGVVSPIRTGTIVDAATSVAANEGAVFTGLTETGFNTGFTEGITPEGASNVFGVTRSAFKALTIERMQNYQRALYQSGIVAASMQPEVRSAAVTLSALTSPLGAANKDLISGAISAGRALDPDEITSRVSAASDMVSQNLPLLADTGVVYTKANKALDVSSSVIILPTSYIHESTPSSRAMMTLDDMGNEVLLSERLKGSGNNRSSSVRVSMPTRDTDTIAFNVGGTLDKTATDLERRRAAFHVQEIQRIFRERDEAKTPKEMVEAGLATSEEQAKTTKQFLADGSDKLDEIARKEAERGMQIGSVTAADIGSGNMRQAVEAIRNVSGGIDNDIIAVEKGLLFDAPLASSEGGLVFTPRISDDALEEAQRVGGIGADIASKAESTNQLNLVQGMIRRGVDTAGEDGGGFFGRLRSFATSRRPDEEMAGSSRPMSRRFRDMDIEQRMKFLKPKIFKGAGAVAALSAGYYLATRSRKNSLYNETMEQQQFEPGPMSIQDFNQIDQQLAAQSSSRRDPLVTAGVVGNLDRNKTSHYKMGPGKYNHLYGG